ncbi:hypothetical protein [Mycolicibacterium lutetiense]
MCAAWASGVTAVKLFPAGRLGIGYLRDLRAPLPDIPLIPTGGIGFDSISDWLDAGIADLARALSPPSDPVLR